MNQNLFHHVEDDNVFFETEEKKYHSVVGKLLHIVVSTRPDMCIAQSILESSAQDPRQV